MNQNLVVTNGNCSDKKGAIARCLEEVLYKENILFKSERDEFFDEYFEGEDPLYDYSLYFSGETIDTIRVTLTPIEEDKLITMKCFFPNIVPNNCNEEALSRECEKLNYLYGDHVEFSFWAHDDDDSRVIVTFTYNMEEIEADEENDEYENLRWITTPKELAEWSIEGAKLMAKIVDQAFLGLVYAAWKE